MVASTPVLIWAGRTGGAELGGGTEWTAVYEVRTSDPLDGPVVAVNAVGNVHPLGSIYAVGNDIDLTAVCKSITPTQNGDSRLSWHVACRFSQPEFDLDDRFPRDRNGRKTTNVDVITTELTATKVKVSVPVTSAVLHTDLPSIGLKKGTRTPVVGPTGEILTPPLEKEVSRTVYRVIKYKKAFPAEHFDSVDSVNSDEFTVKTLVPKFERRFKKYTCKFENLIPSKVLLGANHVWRLEYEWQEWLKKSFDGRKIIGWRVEVPCFGSSVVIEEGDTDGRGGTITRAFLDSIGAAQGGGPAVYDQNQQVITRKLTDAYGHPYPHTMLDRKGKPVAKGKTSDFILYATHEEIPFAKFRLGD